MLVAVIKHDIDEELLERYLLARLALHRIQSWPDICFCSANVPCIQPSFLFLVKAAALPSMKTLVVSLATSGPHYRSNDLVYISWVYIRGMGFLPNGLFNWKHECVACPKTLQTSKINHQRDINALPLLTFKVAP